MNQQLLERVLRSPRLPSLPTIAIEVIDLVQQRDVNIKQIANTISHDPAMSSKILRTVNSSFYGQSQPISTVTHALVILGLNSVKTLALGFSLVGNLKDASAEGFNHFAFWKRSLYTAVAGRFLAKELGLMQQEEVFLGGLMHDLGMLAMSQTLGPEYSALVAQAGLDHSALIRGCREKYQTDHAEIGGELAAHWKLPPVLVAPIRFHADPDSAPADLAALVRCVVLGNRVADVFMSPTPGQAVDAFYQQACKWFDLPSERTEALLTYSHNSFAEMRRLFDLPTGPADDAQDILARANDALLQMTLQQEQKTTVLEQQNRELAHQAVTDSLTGAANRRRFNEFIAEQFDAARKSGQPLSVLFLDADHFKHFNDQYGHPLGDRVLIELASAVQRSLPESALVARYGGEEFAAVLPGTNRATAAGLAEKVRQEVAAAVVTSDEGQELSITASIGVASFDGQCFERHEQLVKAADQGVYAAKAAGRNCVRVFAPRPKVPAAA